MKIRDIRSEAVTVGELTQAIKGLLEEGLGSVIVVGEVSNYKVASSGHRYFTLKDDDAAISCVMWKSRSLQNDPREGDRVVVGGRLTVYPPRGNYQLDVHALRPEGVGDLYATFERLKQALAERGWFDAAGKTSIPTMPRRVGIITSPTGAALHDMLTTISRRNPLVEVLFRPALVQGDAAAADVARAIAEMDAAGVDVMIVGRGGGSLEDLWSFNTEVVAAAIHRATTPIISAVGHETDVTIADFVADVRAATPTAAAEFVTPITLTMIQAEIDRSAQRMCDALLDRVQELRRLAEGFIDGTAADRLTERLHLRGQRIDDVTGRMQVHLRHRVQQLTHLVDHRQEHLQSMHPYRPLRLGYAIVERNGSPIPASAPLAPHDEITLRRYNQTADVVVHNVSATDLSPNLLQTQHGQENSSPLD